MTTTIDYKERLIVFTRYPKPGTTKTRLAPVLGMEGAAELQRRMTENTLLQVERLSEDRKICVEIHYEGSDEALMKDWLGSDFVYRQQDSGDIGLRMRRSFEDAFTRGADSAVIIGTDIPDITQDLLESAFNDLRQYNMVLGPAKDGGYYLIGFQRDSMSRAIPDLFAGITWGIDNVFDETIRIARDLSINFSFLAVLQDVDRPEDLSIWERARRRKRRDLSSNFISVVIPVINEADNIVKTLTKIGTADNIETIVVDGGSHDGTVPLAKSLGAKIVNTSPPKARQMNLGAATATGDILLFLHADTMVPGRFDEHIIHALGQAGVVAGAFELRIDSPAPLLRLIERFANWRSHRLRLPYGDQGIFIKSELFRRMGGFCDIPIMEDFELVRRLRKKGEVATLAVPVFTSSRRWESLGVLKTTLINQLVIAAYRTGISPEKIARWYLRSKGVLKKKRSGENARFGF